MGTASASDAPHTSGRPMNDTRSKDRPIDSLDSKHTMAIILLLHENGPCRRTDIYDRVSKNASIPKKIQMMIETGIIVEISYEGGSRFDLTDSGRMVAEHLSSIERIIACER